ncbi:MAG: UbiA prenyltransferase family protein [Sulfurimonas sp.]|uniref:UbiA prenyltransferase family protein n=1 Tax=Sulfurimonas sp. TaxID=2022749 RepID=UPI00262C28F9|nr:UbiA prenyltransferase family protein [Sulfurimonas sp.]MCW8894449.1 UbiA prenyltransferase family protein [Sulfurimonas sp.]MCW8954065.1 UbiA prenyltransferase family protein [Sulfurimonas sp.]
MREIFKLFRVHQYIKNLFIFMPLLFSFSFSNLENNLNTLVAFILFSILASSIYIFNDLMDINEDRAHPKKKYRPLASGAVSAKTAKMLIALLALSSLFISFVFNFDLFLVLFAYFILNIAYSLKLKHISILDIFIIATGFVLRLFAGSAVTDIELSMWIILMTFLLAIFLALAKRRDDVLLSLEGQETRKNIDGYNLEFVNAAMVLMAGVVIVSYIQYTISAEVIARLGSHYLYLTSFFVILGVLRYMQITFVEQNSGSPTKVVIRDMFMKLTIAFWLISFIMIVKFI